MDVIQREKALSILKHYGAPDQRRQLCEECAELIQAICKYERAAEYGCITGDLSHIENAENEIAGEIADVLIMIEQIKFAVLGGDHANLIERLIDYKLNRQLERIKKEESDRG